MICGTELLHHMLLTTCGMERRHCAARSLAPVECRGSTSTNLLLNLKGFNINITISTTTICSTRLSVMLSWRMIWTTSMMSPRHVALARRQSDPQCAAAPAPVESPARCPPVVSNLEEHQSCLLANRAGSPRHDLRLKPRLRSAWLCD